MFTEVSVVGVKTTNSAFVISFIGSGRNLDPSLLSSGTAAISAFRFAVAGIFIFCPTLRDLTPIVGLILSNSLMVIPYFLVIEYLDSFAKTSVVVTSELGFVVSV